jgi:hypothetical protein
MPVIGTYKPVRFVHLWAEMAEYQDCRLIWTKEEGADKDFKVVHHFLIPIHKLRIDGKNFGLRERTVYRLRLIR